MLWTTSVGEVHNQKNLSLISKTHLKRPSVVVCTYNLALGRWRQAEGPCALPSLAQLQISDRPCLKKKSCMTPEEQDTCTRAAEMHTYHTNTHT